MAQTYVFIAWGIGITPFRSIIKNLIDTKRNESITLFYLSKKDDFLFQEIFKDAEKQLGIHTIYVENKTMLDETFLKKYFKDLQQKTFYLSGPQRKVEDQREVLMNSGIGTEQIKTDLFTGYEV